VSNTLVIGTSLQDTFDVSVQLIERRQDTFDVSVQLIERRRVNHILVYFLGVIDASLQFIIHNSQFIIMNYAL